MGQNILELDKHIIFLNTKPSIPGILQKMLKRHSSRLVIAKGEGGQGREGLGVWY